jgi:hypothetical protein
MQQGMNASNPNLKLKGDKEDINEFHNLLNTLCNDIQFTLEYSETKIPFLYVLVMKEGT